MSVIEGGVHPSRLDMVSELVYVLVFICKGFFVQRLDNGIHLKIFLRSG